jgi:glycosyltransferase involved in cell wall biosynthesis
MRPALDGHAGIPQETRLLFQALIKLVDIEIEGLLQSSNRVLAKALPASDRIEYNGLSIDEKINRLSRVVISLQQDSNPRLPERLRGLLALGVTPTIMLLQRLMGLDQKLGKFDGTHFRDFVWRSMFAKTLPVEDFDAVTGAGFRVSRVPWAAMHAGALFTLKLGRALYPRLDTSDFDIMIAETPYPASVSKCTKLVIRYHDAIPLLMPHTIINKSTHQASHYQALRRNVLDGAYFACVSDATRKDLLSIFPQVEDRAVTIHNMVSPYYFDTPSNPARVPDIIRTRAHTGVWGHEKKKQHREIVIDDLKGSLMYLLMVSTIEPRKNHTTLLSAWEQLRAERFPELKLVVVGTLGWGHLAIVDKFGPWLERGELFMLEDVPAEELRVLYQHASATVCPSFGEGFDFSGVEAMCCGGVVVASSIGVHREIYGDAAQYFSPYSVTEMAEAICLVVNPTETNRRVELIQASARISKNYQPSKILPKWQELLQRLTLVPVI